MFFLSYKHIGMPLLKKRQINVKSYDLPNYNDKKREWIWPLLFEGKKKRR